MSKCDMVIALRAADGSVSIGDYWSTGEVLPTLDETQSLSMLKAESHDGRTTVRFSRRLDTGDVRDSRLSGSAGAETNIIYAWKDAATHSATGLQARLHCRH